MDHSTWLAIITAQLSLILSGLVIILKLLFSWRASLLADMDKLESSVKDKINEYCNENARSHEQIWDRINHHEHKEDGAVVIPRR